MFNKLTLAVSGLALAAAIIVACLGVNLTIVPTVTVQTFEDGRASNLALSIPPMAISAPTAKKTALPSMPRRKPDLSIMRDVASR